MSLDNSYILKKHRYRDWFFYAFVTLMTFLLYQRDIGGFGISKFVFLFIVVAYAIIADYRHLMMALAFVMPLTNGLPGNYILPLMCAIILYKGYKKLQASPIVWIAIALIIISELLHVFVFASEPHMPELIRYCSDIFLLIVIGGTDCNEDDNAQNALAFCMGSVVMLTIILINSDGILGLSSQDWDERMGHPEQLNDDGNLMLNTNPNNIGLFSIAAMTISFALWYYKKIPLWMLSILIVLAFIAGMFSVSRTWVLSILVFGFFFLLCNKVKSFVPLFVVVLGGIGMYYFFTHNGNFVWDLYVDRFSDSTVETGGLRTTLFVDYHNWMFNNEWALIFGTGAETYKEVTLQFNSTHNALQQIFIAYGIPGFLFFMYLLYRSIKKWYVTNEKMALIPMIVISFFLQSGQFLNPSYCMYPFIASLFILKMAKSDSVRNCSTITINTAQEAS